jgi:hypothetical protein
MRRAPTQPNPTPKASFKTGATLPDVWLALATVTGRGSRAPYEMWGELGRGSVGWSARSWTHVCVWYCGVEQHAMMQRQPAGRF